MLVAEREDRSPARVTDSEGPAPAVTRRPEQVITAIIVFAPLLALGIAVVLAWGWGIRPRDVGIALALYGLTGYGVTVGFHRLFAHRSFRAPRPIRVVLAVAGSMTFQGPVIGWVADHRRHHAFTDTDGDPHSPHCYGEGFIARGRGLWHAHVGWLFDNDPTSQSRYARDLVADRDLVVIDRLFPVWCALSLAIPFALGWLIGGTLAAAGTALLWGGAVRICLLHHVTWSINSLCHTFGRRPYRTHDRSTNLSALSVISLGESFHNTHHAFPSSARHGLDRGQLDSSAALIRGLERIGWVSHVRQPGFERRQTRSIEAP